MLTYADAWWPWRIDVGAANEGSRNHLRLLLVSTNELVESCQLLVSIRKRFIACTCDTYMHASLTALFYACAC